MSGWRLIALHALSAAVFFFVLQRFVMAQSTQVSVVWSGAGAVAAAGLAWWQQNR